MNITSENIRNIALLGHSGSGKTTFCETMLYESNAIQRRGNIEDKSTISDHTNIEKEKMYSIFSSLTHMFWKDSKINVLDTPGSDDFIGEVVSSLKVSDTALLLLNAQNGVEVGTEIMWEYIQKFNTPSIIVVNQIDHEKADFETTLSQAKERFGSKVIELQYPFKTNDGSTAIIDCLRMIMYKFGPEGGKPEKLDIPEDERNRAFNLHNELVEIAAENDEGLMELFFDKGTLSEDELAKGLKLALAQQSFHPVFCTSAIKNIGSGRIMGFINDIVPSPAERLQGDAVDSESDEACIFIYKTMSEPRVGNLSYFKVYSGKISAGLDLYNNDTQGSERLNQLYFCEGKNRINADEIVAGDIGVTVKLKNSHTNQTLVPKGSEKQIEPINFPSSRIRMAVKAPNKNDMEKLSAALHAIEKEDLTLIIEQSQELRQTIVYGQGELHLDIIKYRLEKVNGIQLEYYKPRIPYRETITKTANSMYRHKKQSGGSGQFAEIHMRIEPYYDGIPDPDDLNVRNTEMDELKWGGKLVFNNCIVGGAIDTKFLSAIKKGVMSKMENGPLTGSYCRDIRVSIFDGKMHPVDSNDMAFQIAATMAFKEAFNNAAPQLLEPIYNIEVLCSDEVMGDVMSDLQTRRSIIMGIEAEGHYQKIMAKTPLAELHKYTSTLRSLSQGRAKFSMSYDSYAPVTMDVQMQVVKDVERELEEA